MKNQNDSANELSNLRHKAEMQFPHAVPVFPLSESDTQRLIHELEVHQIELEMQLGELALAKKQLEDAVTQKKILYDFEPSGYFTLSEEGKIADVNLSGSKMLGTESSGLIGGRFDFFVTDDTKPRFNHFLESVFRSKTKETCELTLQTSDHSPKFILLQAVATNDGEQCYVNVVDITDKKLAETLPQETLERLQQITKSVPSLVYQFRLYPDGRYCFPFASEFIRDYYGIIPDEIREDGRSAVEKVHPDDRARLIASIHASAHELSPWQHEFRVTLPDGSFQTLFANSLPQREKDGAVLWHGFISDISYKKQVEEELQRVHWRLESIAEATQTGIWEWHIQTDEVVINDLWAQIVGYTTDELSPLNTESFRLMVHPDDLKQADELLARHFSGELPYFDFEGRVKHKDGRWIWIHDRGSVISRSDDGKPRLMFGTHTDITDRKQTEETLLESEKRHQLLFENSLTGIMVTHPDGAILSVNPEACRMFGRTEADICKLGRHGVVDLKNPNLAIALEKRRQTGHFHGELTYKRGDGTVFPVDIESGIFTDANGQDYAYNFFQDITERKQKEQILRDSEEHLQLALSGAQMGMWELNVKTMAATIGTHAAQILGYQKEEIAGDKLAWDYLTHPDDVPQIEKIITNLLSGKTPFFESEHRKQHASGEYRWVSSRGKITKRDQDGSPLLISGTILDITERKLTEKTLVSQQNLLSKLTQFSIDLSRLSSEENLEVFICKQIKELTGAIGVLFSEYCEESRLIFPKHVELEASLLSKVVRRLDNQIQAIHSQLNEESYQRITQVIIEKYDSLTDASFGTVSRPTGAILSALLKADRYIGVSYMVDGKLYGTSLLVMGKQQPDPPIEFLENIASLVALSLRRKRAEEALKESEYKYKFLTESNLDVVFIIDKLGRLLFVNESVKPILGYDPEEVTGKSLVSFVNEKQIPEAFLQLGRAFIHKEVTCFITRIYHKDRHLVDVEINGKIVGFNGQTVGQGTIRDITEKKRIEDRLKISLDRNKALLGANPDMMFVFDSACRIIDFHAESIEKLYVKPDLFLNKPVDEIFSPEISLMTHQCVKAVLSTGRPDYSTYELPMGDTLKSFESRYVLCGKHEVLSIVRDITDRKLAEEALLKRKQQYDNLVAKIPVGVYILRSKPDGTFALDYASPRAAEMLCLSIESFLADSEAIFKAIHPEDVDGFRTLSQEGIAQHRPFNWIGRIVADGTVKWMHFRSTPELLENGDTLWHGLIADITERKQAEEEITLKNEELSNLVAEKDKFFSVLAHDLRSPFNTILGFTQMLEEDLPTMDFDQIKRISSVLRNSAFSAYTLLENLLEWSRMKRGMTSYNPETFSLKFQIDESLQVVMELARKKWIEISVRIPEDLRVLADENMMSSIIRNLATNAIKFTPKYGTVLFSARVNDDQNIEISVKDSGIGMNQKILNKLFGNDEHNNRKGTEGESSSGLGLVICKEFVEKHGGRIWAESEEGKGSTFYFTLPQSREKIEPMK